MNDSKHAGSAFLIKIENEQVSRDEKK